MAGMCDMRCLDILDRRADQAIAVMEEMAERDNNFYRVMMGSDAKLILLGRFCNREKAHSWFKKLLTTRYYAYS